MRIGRLGVMIVVGLVWLAAAAAFLPEAPARSRRRPTGTARVVGGTTLPTHACRDALPAAVPDGPWEAAAGEREADVPLSPATGSVPGPTGVADAVAELERVLGGPDFAPTMESVRRSLVSLLASDPRAVEEAIRHALDLRAAGEVRAVLVEALSCGPSASRAADVTPALLMDTSRAVREAAWRGLAVASRRP